MSGGRAGLILGLLLLASPAMAGLQLVLEAPDLTPAERQASQQLLGRALDRLPPRFVQQLDRAIPVHWQAGWPAELYGRAGPYSLALNRQFLPALVEGQAGPGHLLLATLLHELVHFYDRAALWPAETRARLNRCSQLATRLGLAGLARDCQSQTARRFTLSDDPRLLDLAGWPRRMGGRGEREPWNGLVARSPDPYELDSPREFVAVNLEYFLLDPAYACRRPALYRYFRQHFAWSPPARSCAATLPVLDAGHDFSQPPLRQIRPEQVYAVDYLFAEGNDEWASHWGHSMLRLVICAPDRPPGPDCRLDLDQHLVLSFRAFVDDVQLSSWRGLTGDYPSRLFVLPLGQVIDEYTKMELRGLVSVPLQLSPLQRRQLVERSVELHWGYDGRYYFLSNNCAVETLALLRAGTGSDRMAALETITPSGLLDLLVRRGLADSRVLDDPREALRLGYRFDSWRERYQAMFEVIRQRLAVPQRRVEDWLAQAAGARRAWFARADLQAAAALLLLEQAAQLRQILLGRDELKRRYLEENSPELAGADQTLRAMLANSGYLSRPAGLLEGQGYGIPLSVEWSRVEQESRQRQARLQQLSARLDQQLRQLLPAGRRAELEATEANQAWLGQHLRALHRASGGLLLP